MAGYFDALNAYLPNQQDPLLQAMGRGRIASNGPMPQFSPEMLTLFANGQSPAPTTPADTGVSSAPALAPAQSDYDPRQAGLDAEYRDLKARLDAKVSKNLALQEQGVTQFNKAIQDYRNKPTQIDFSPLAAYFDSNVEGSNLLKGYKAPESETQKQEKLLGMENLLQKTKEGMSDKDIDYMRVMLSQNRSDKQDARQSRFDQAQDKAMFNQARKEQAGLVKEAGDFRNSYASVEAAIKPDANGQIPVARLQMSLSQFSRLMGEKGVLTDTDIGRQLQNTIDLSLAKYAQMLSSDPNAKIDARAADAMRAALVDAKKVFQDNYKLKADTFTEGYFNNPGSPYAGKKWAKKLVEDTYKPLDLIGKQATGGQPPANDPRARLEELRRKAQGG